jgi:hypothetical protein
MIRLLVLLALSIVGTWSVAFVERWKTLTRCGDVAQAREIFLTLIDRGFIGVAAGIAGTPYAFASAVRKRSD